MKATIVNNVENTTKVVELADNVKTVSELKKALGISDGRIFEGTTHTDLVSDRSDLPTLPENKVERGYVFFVSPSQTKTKNGAYSRKECYSIIKERHLEDVVKSLYRRNFTQVATDALNNVIASESGESVNDTPATLSTPHTTNSTPTNTTDATDDVVEKDIFLALADAITDESKKEDVVKMINAVFHNPYSVQDLANMNNH